MITLLSFGANLRDVPPGLDLLVDAREFPNPPRALRAGTGLDRPVADYVLLTNPLAVPLCHQIAATIDILASDHDTVSAAVMCATGRHRAPAIVEFLAGWLRAAYNRDVSTRHLELEGPAE